MPGFPLFTHIKPVELLEKYGLKPEGMTDVVLTHAHHDHSDGLRYYPQARLFIHPAEWSRLKLSRPGELVPVEDECLIAPGVRMKVIGGHSRGSAVVLVDGGEKTWLLCGDECYDRENLSKQIPTGASCCQEKSRRFIEEYGRGIYEPIIFHDLNLISSIGSRVLLEVE